MNQESGIRNQGRRPCLRHAGGKASRYFNSLIHYSLFIILAAAIFAAAPAHATPATPQETTERGIQERFSNFFRVATPIPGEEDGPTPIGVRVGSILSTLLLLVGMVFLIITVYSGITWMMAGGNEETIEKSRTRIKRATIGLIIVVGAWIITNFVLRAAFGPTRTPSGGAVQFRIFENAQ